MNSPEMRPMMRPMPVEVKPSGATLILIDDLDRAVSRLDTQVEALYSRLGPILNPEGPRCTAGSEEKDCPGAICFVADKLNDLVNRLAVLACNVGSIADRVDL